MNEKNKKEILSRGAFATSIGAVIATLGSAIGLGNIWKFPFIAGENGGAAFLIVYIASTILVGLPVMISEIALGRKARANAITTMQKLNPKKGQPWWLIGALGALAAFTIMAFYTEVAGWVYAYIFKSLNTSGLSTNPQVTEKAFTDLITSPWQSLIWQWVVLGIVSVIIIKGVSKGIERVTKFMIPSLLVMVVIIAIRSLTLDPVATSKGLSFLFRPDFSKLGWDVVLIAMGLAFFKLSVGMGTMITYGSYWQNDQNIPYRTATVMLSDLAVSLLAGLAIFPAVFAFGFEPASGASLMFITIPAVFASMPFGQIFMVLFFILASFAATGAMISLIEVPVAYINENFNISRLKATIATNLTLALIGSLAALSNSVLADFKLFDLTMFDLFDYVSSNLMLPIGGLFIAIFVGWIWGKKNIEAALNNAGTLNNHVIVNVFTFIVRFITPVLIIIILLGGLGVF
ncbi:MAG: sodium-dependent transporter [Anaerolineaceae bacterium]|nr:sodium-dependent transporter [Anaerolineaceae bacterium]